MNTERIGPSSHVTLRYRLAPAGGSDFVSTFDGPPATFQMGGGQLAEALETCLVGLAAGDRRTFDLREDAFGERRADLVRRVRRSDIPPEVALAAGEPVELWGPGNQPINALVRDVDEDSVTLDFNHPLAGRPLVFEVEVIAVL